MARLHAQHPEALKYCMGNVTLCGAYGTVAVSQEAVTCKRCLAMRKTKATGHIETPAAVAREAINIARGVYSNFHQQSLHTARNDREGAARKMASGAAAVVSALEERFGIKAPAAPGGSRRGGGTTKACGCRGRCRGADELGPGWHCVMELQEP